MMLWRTLLVAIVAGVCTPAYAHSPGDYHMYFIEAFARYGQAVEACEARRQAKEPPSTEVISEIDQYELQNARVFLIYNDFKQMQRCSSDATVEILIAVESLGKVENLRKETRKAVEALRETLFFKTDLAFEMKYRKLPKAMRNDLEQLDYFQTPFQAYSVLDEIESRPQ